MFIFFFPIIYKSLTGGGGYIYVGDYNVRINVIR